VKWKSTATATVLKTDPERNTQEYKEEHVGRWRKRTTFKQNYLPQVLLISDEFEIPQLNRTRKIWALLPHDYMMIQRKDTL
jgi:hypothetical protein